MTDHSDDERRARDLEALINGRIRSACAGAQPEQWFEIADREAGHALSSLWTFRIDRGAGGIPEVKIARIQGA